MAMAMKLNEASKEILTVPADSPRFQDLQDKARLVCLSSLLPLVFLTVLFFFSVGFVGKCGIYVNYINLSLWPLRSLC
jgi:hypothetical protein